MFWRNLLLPHQGANCTVGTSSIARIPQ